MSSTPGVLATVGFCPADPRGWGGPFAMALQASTTDRLLEREGELAALRDVLSRHGSVAVIEAPAGVGKTALMDAARTIAEDSGLLVLTARGAELEQAFAFGAVRQLFEHGASTEAFTGAARFAAPLIGVELEGVPAAAAGGSLRRPARALLADREPRRGAAAGAVRR